MYSATTQSVRVTVTPEYDRDRSDAGSGRHFWLYTIEITNLGLPRIQLMTRHWHITDANGEENHVSGDGVVGEQPVLASGESFTYTSGVPLATSSGFMQGSYEMRHVDGDARFIVEIPAFSLDLPHDTPVLN